MWRSPGKRTCPLALLGQRCLRRLIFGVWEWGTEFVTRGSRHLRNGAVRGLGKKGYPGTSPSSLGLRF